MTWLLRDWSGVLAVDVEGEEWTGYLAVDVEGEGQVWGT